MRRFFFLCAVAGLALANPGQIAKLLTTPGGEVRLAEDLQPLQAEMEVQLQSIRHYLVLESGFLTPALTFTVDKSLAPGHFEITLDKQPAGRGELRRDCVLVVAKAAVLAKFPGPETTDPTYGLPAKWIPTSQKAAATRAGALVFDPVGVWATVLTEGVRDHDQDLLTSDQVDLLLENAPPALSNRIVADAASQAKLLQVCRNLLAEGVSLRDMEAICEALLVGGDADQCTERARQALRASICRDLADARRNISVSMVAPEADLKAVKTAVERMQKRGEAPVLCTSAADRLALHKRVAKEFPHLRVISEEERAPGFHFVPDKPES